jgi:hypothetical protein
MNKYICEFCLDNFATTNALIKHQKTFKRCLDYKDVIFTCKKCNFSTIGIKNIENHKCSKTIVIDSDDINDYIIEESDEDNITEDLNLQKHIIKVENELKKEKIKNETLLNIIEKYIPVKNINLENKLNLEISPSIEEEKIYQKFTPVSPCNSDDDKSDNKKDIYRTYKSLKTNSIDLIEEPDIKELETKIQDIDLKLIFNTKQNFVNLEHCNMIFDKEIETIKTAKTYIKNITNIKNNRKKLLGSLSFNDYINILNKDINHLKISLGNKGLTEKKINSTISKSLGSLDSRFIYYGNYYDIPMDIDEFVRFKSSIQMFAHSSSYYTHFNYQNFISKFYNYGSVIIPIKECIEYYIINKYGFNNIIYVPIKQSSSDDPYSFYVLEDIIKEKRYWKMDCRLIDISDSIMTNLKEYLTSIFRKIYLDIFTDNDYRDDYKDKTVITSVDFVQLLQNILLLSDKKEFYKIIKKIIIDNATYTPTENDKFNLYRDDPLLKKKFQSFKEEDKTDSIKMLFDNITSEKAVDFYRSIRGSL